MDLLSWDNWSLSLINELGAVRKTAVSLEPLDISRSNQTLLESGCLPGSCQVIGNLLSITLQMKWTVN
jgi:hypothetical protein